MRRAQFTFEGLDAIERRLRRAGPDASHVQVWDRTERGNEENLGRFDLTEADARPFLDGWEAEGDADDVPSDDASGEDADDDVDSEPDDDDGLAGAMQETRRTSRALATSASKRPLKLAEIAEAACRWLRDVATRNTVGEPYRRFRVRLYGPKGMRTLDSGTFVCKNEDHDLDLPVPAQSSALTPDENGRPHDREIPAPSFEAVELHGASRGMRALGDYYAQWGRIVLGSVHQLQGVNDKMVVKLHSQLDASRDQVDELVGAILNLRASEMEVAEQRRASDKSDDSRTEIAKHALQQFGDAAKAFLAARGVTPEMADVFGTLGQSPDLMAALGDPDVRALMQDPQNLKMLAGLLRQAAAQQKAMNAAPPTEQAA